MELLAGAAAAAWGGGELFSYNRENYMFDKARAPAASLFQNVPTIFDSCILMLLYQVIHVEFPFSADDRWVRSF